jgi:hypothetical protein
MANEGVKVQPAFLLDFECIHKRFVQLFGLHYVHNDNIPRTALDSIIHSLIRLLFFFNLLDLAVSI